MRCPQCQHENRESAKFCKACGTKLELVCPTCDTRNELGATFCDNCGARLSAQFPVSQSSNARPQTLDARPISYTPPHLAERIRAEQAAIEARGAAEGERKTITALFAYIKDSTALIEDLDPEEARHIIDPALALMMDAVHRYEGHVTQSLGDGIFALFGAPIAHEDHPQRALYAALLMQADSKRHAERLRRERGINLQLRVGVNTGEVVVRSIRKDDLHTDYVPIGHSTNLAARMESLAAGGTIVVSEHTYKLTEGYFQFTPLGAAQVKGVSEPLNIYEVLGIGPLRTKLQVAAKRGFVRFVGRQDEMEQMKRALALAKEGHGQIVAVMGEPGVGKSRLVHEFKLSSQGGCLVLETFSVSHGKAYLYLPLIELLKNYFHITLQDEERGVREKVTGKVLTLDRSLEDTLPYLFALLSVADPASSMQQLDPYSMQQMDPQIRRRRTFEAIKRLLVRESLNQPLLVIFEDLHWLDNETQAFLSFLSESVATARMLLVVNYRPEYRHDWGNRTYYTQLRLDPLGKEEAQELLTALLGESTALSPLKQFILEKTEGNPFFMEEIVQALREQGVLSMGATGRAHLSAALHLPPTVQGVLAARIDRLPAVEKDLLQTMAVIGKEFPVSLLKHVVDRPEEELQLLLSHLQTAEFIYEQPAFPEVEYTFKHALTQEVSYNSLLIERRRGLHERAAQAIEAVFHYRLEDYYNELAYHYSRSGNTHKAIEYLQLAGQQAVQRSANAQAVSHLTSALALLTALPDSPQRAQQELTLQVALGVALGAMTGYSSREMETVYTRARELCRQVGDTPQLFPVLWGLYIVYLVRAELQTARELAEQFLSLAQSVQDAELLLWAHYALGATLTWLGEFTRGLEHVRQSSALYDPQHHRSHTLLYGQDPGVACLGFTAWGLWFLGYPDQALQKSREALSLARELAHPSTSVYALDWAAMFHQFRGEQQTAQERAEAAITVSTEQGLPLWLAWGAVVRGWALAERGQAEEGVTQIRQSLAALQTMGGELAGPYRLALLAEVYGKGGQTAEGLAVLAEALVAVDNRAECWWEAELYRLKGELVLQSQVQGPNAKVEKEAEECFYKAVEVARRQQAKSLELRAVMSLARLWQQQSKKNEARQMLAEVYGWFTEGFDTADLKEAKALLEELGP
jgi:class 3 adenylate cyclase/predicted ATPase